MKHIAIGTVLLGAVEVVENIPVGEIIKWGIQIIVGACALFNAYLNHKKSKKK